MKNAKIMATIVAVIFSMLVVGTASAQTRLYEEKNRQIFGNGRITAYVQTDECTQKDVWVTFSDETSSKKKIAGSRIEITKDHPVTLQVSMHIIDFCQNTYTYLWGMTNVEPNSATEGKLEMEGEVTVSDESGENAATIIVDVDLTANTNGFYGNDISSSNVWGPNAYKATYDFARIWADATAEGHVTIDGIPVFVNGQIGEVSISVNNNRTVSSEEIDPKG